MGWLPGRTLTARWDRWTGVVSHREPGVAPGLEAAREVGGAPQPEVLECGGGQSDYVAVEAADRDAQWYQLTQGRNRWWDATNLTLPNFKQAFRWVKALSERMGKPNLWWQLPVGNMNLLGFDKQWKDNRLDYFFDHPREVAAAHGLGMVFGAGELAQTNPSTDSQHLVNRTNAYFFNGGQSICTSTP